MTKTLIFYIIFLLNAASMVGGAKKAKGVALVNGVAEFRCTLEKLKGIPEVKVDIYWQRGDDVLSMKSEGDRSPHISSRYRNRTFLEGYKDLKLVNVNFEDQGLYECYAFHVDGGKREKVDDCTYHLDVLANYSEPEISYEPSVQIVDNGTSMHFKCSSGHGFPQPQRIIWETSSGNRTKISIKSPEIKNINQTFNASSEFLLKVEEDVNITCVLEAHHNVTSKVLQIVVKREIPPDTPDRSLNIIIILSVCFIICFTATTLTWAVCRKKKQSRARVNGCSRGHQMGPVTAVSQEQHILMSAE